MKFPAVTRGVWDGDSSVSALSDGTAECRSSSWKTPFSLLSSFPLSLATEYFASSLCLGLAPLLAASCAPRWGFSLRLEVPVWNACPGFSPGFSARICCWATNLSLGYWPEFVFCWFDGEPWQRLPISRAAWQPLPWAGMLAALDYFFFFPFLFTFPFRPARWASILLGPVRAAWLGAAGLFLSRSTFHFPKVRPSIHPPPTLAALSRAALLEWWHRSLLVPAAGFGITCAGLFCVSNLL